MCAFTSVLLMCMHAFLGMKSSIKEMRKNLMMRNFETNHAMNQARSKRKPTAHTRWLFATDTRKAIHRTEHETIDSTKGSGEPCSSVVRLFTRIPHNIHTAYTFHHKISFWVCVPYVCCLRMKGGNSGR